jgi:hypothetical protein
MSRTQELLRDQVAFYEQHAESWKTAYDAGQECFDYEALVATGIFAFRQISRVDEHWHEKLFLEKVAHNSDFEHGIYDLYRKWAVVSDVVSREIAKLEAQGFSVDGAKEFRECIAEARGALLPDRHFFTGKKINDLRDEAIDKHQRGETAEMGSVTD